MILCLAVASPLKAENPYKVTPDQCKILPNCRCYTKEGIDIAAKATVDLEKCQKDLQIRENLIKERMEIFNANEGEAWWQNPSTIVAGIVISASVATVITAIVMKK
jgi:hypothetical protein